MMSESSKTILLIDDEPGMRKMIKRLLAIHSEYNFLETETVTAGLEIARNQHPDLIITDHDTGPGLKGLDLVREIHDIPIILISGTPGATQEAIKLGAKFGINKPFTVLKLLTAVSSILG